MVSCKDNCNKVVNHDESEKYYKTMEVNVSGKSLTTALNSILLNFLI
jgi:hypothetical protein